jgi:aspartate aminotransferase
MNFARRLQPIKPSQTLAQNAKVKALVAKGVEVLSFVAGEPDFDTPEFVKQAAIAALAAGFTKYTVTAGMPELRAAICEKLRRDNQLEYVPEQILVSNGAKHSIYNFFQAMLNEGDEVIIFAPYWVSYPDMVLLAGGKPVIVDTDERNGFVPDPNRFRRALSPRTKAIVINSPGNPTGSVLPREALIEMGAALHDRDCLILTDDIYEKLLFRPEPFVNIVNVMPELYGRTVVVNGMSKAFAMTGWRIGYAAGPREIIAAMTLIQDQATSSPSSLGQKAAIAALQGPKESTDTMVAEFKARRDIIVHGLNAIAGFSCATPDGAFYAFPRVQEVLERRYKGRRISGSIELADILLDDFRVAVVAGQPFGAEGHIRMSFATSRQTIEKGLARLKEFSASLKS